MAQAPRWQQRERDMSKLKGFCTPEQAAELDEIERRESSNCEGFAPGANPDRCEHCGARAEQHARGEKPREGATPSQQEVSANLVHRLRWAASYGSFVDVRKMSREAADFLESLPSATENSDMAKVVFDNLPYLENLILPRGHESPLLRTHPFPCAGHDFCLVHQAQKGADAIRAALDSATADNRVEREGKDG
jgi:hypothetical protein